MSRPFLVYRDRIAPASEISFLRRQYVGFSSLRPIWIGRHLTPLAEQLGMAVTRLGGGAPLGTARRLLFRHFGIVPALPERDRLARVVHAQFARGGALALPLARSLDAALVVTLHGGDVGKRKNWRATLQARRWPEVTDYAARFVCVSSHVATLAAQHGVPEEKLTVLPIGADLPTVPSPPPSGPSYHLFVGRFVAKKGLETLAGAVRRLRAEGDRTPVICIGDGPLRPLLETLARDAGPVALPGWQSPAEVARHMAGACSLLVPSVIAADGDAEGLPSVVAEAMAQACPVIGSDQGGIAEAIAHLRTGLLVPEGDAAALAAAMRQLRVDPALRHALGQAGFAHAQAHLNARVQSAALEAILLDAETV
jgi:colanic acid/amylovoran biosynthesis glycosyltransferase